MGSCISDALRASLGCRLLAKAASQSLDRRRLFDCRDMHMQFMPCHVQVGMIDFFLPYLPLEASHIRRLFGMRLAEEAETLARWPRCRLTWGEAEIDFLVSKVMLR